MAAARSRVRDEPKRLRAADLIGIERSCAQLAVFLTPFSTLRFGGLLFTVSDLLVCLCLFILLLSGRFPTLPLRRATPLWLFGFGLLLLGFLISGAHGSPTRTTIIGLQYFFAYVVLLYVLIRGDAWEAHRLAACFIAGMVVADLIGLGVLYTVGYRPGATIVSGADRLAGFFGTANLNAAMNALTLPLLLYFWLRNALSPLVFLPLLGVIVITLVHTGSNSGLMAAGAGVSVFLLSVMSWRMLWRLVLFGSVAVLVFDVAGGAALLPATFHKRVLGALSSGDISQAGTFDHRLALMREAAEVIAQQGILLVGVGADQFRTISRYEVSVHNMYLLLWVEGGVLALLGWLLFSATAVMLGLVGRRLGSGRDAGAVASAMIVMFLMIGISNPHMYARYWTVPIHLSLGLVMIQLRRRPGAAVEAAGATVRAARAVSRVGRVTPAGVLLGLACVVATVGGARAAGPSAVEVREGLRQAAGFMRERATARGSYGWWYTSDLMERRGEGRMTPTQGWVQPPGMPAVGTAYLQAFEATADAYYLEAAREVGTMLLRTQLRSGGWWYMAEFDPEGRKSWCYRLEPDCRDSEAALENDLRNATTFDDDTTQSALSFLIRLDRLLPAADPELGAGIRYGLDKLVDAQYPNGAWPFRIDRRSKQQVAADARAAFPATWPQSYAPIRNNIFYSTNDQLVRNAIRLFLLAHRAYGEEAYRRTARRAGEFVLAAQMPEPQPGWAQQYNRDMEPIWGRRFEPPSIASRETAGNVDALLELFVYTGEERWLRAAEPAVDWLDRSRLADGSWARFYELETNRPMYFTSDYELTYSDADTPRQYGFRTRLDILEVLARYREVTTDARERCPAARRPGLSLEACAAALADKVAESLISLDDAGRWIEGERIYSATFVRRVELLSAYLAATDGRPLVTGTTTLEYSEEVAKW